MVLLVKKLIFFPPAFKKNCAELFASGVNRDGVYRINNGGTFDVFCDQTTARGGWTVFQKRLDGSVDFYLNWADYKQGFGNLNGEFWLGLDKIHRLTSENNSVLRVDLEDFSGERVFAEYDMFAVQSEDDKYRLILGAYSGNLLSFPIYPFDEAGLTVTTRLSFLFSSS